MDSEREAKSFPDGAILVARRIVGPVLHAAHKAAGCILETNTPLSHSAIMARELGIPAIGAIDLSTIELGYFYQIDGTLGTIDKLSDAERATAVAPAELQDLTTGDTLGDVPDPRLLWTTARYFRDPPPDVAAGFHDNMNVPENEFLRLVSEALGQVPRISTAGNSGAQ